jgi:hypothetical protein
VLKVNCPQQLKTKRTKKMKKTNSMFGSFSANINVEIQNVKLEEENIKIAKGGGDTQDWELR